MKKKILTYAGIILFFMVLAYGFVPQVLTGKIVDQSDISGYLGMARETNVWDAAHPHDKTAWTDAMFGGMPTTMISGNTGGDWTQKIYDAFLIGRRPASYLLISLIGAFLMLLAMGIHPLIAAGGAVAVTFCSYNMQIIQVGHNSKMAAIAWAPWVMAGVLFAYRKALNTKDKWLPVALLGASLFAMALNFQLKANHIQISYYLAIIIFSYVLVLLVWLISSRRQLLGRFFAVSALLLVIGGIGIATNANRLIPTWNYTKYTMRGGSELSRDGDSSSNGLDLAYATSWSYGWEELPNLMVPNYNGGASAGELPMDSETVTVLRQAGQQNLRQVAKSLPLYWGPQPFTAGPMYMGAITVFLFILGLLLCKGKERWWLLIPTLIGIGLALGNHFMPFTKFWYYHMPFYNKFRTVSMALVILQLTLPMLGFLVLDRIVKAKYGKKEFIRAGVVAFALTGGFCLLCLLFPGIAGSFSGSSDAGMPDVLVDALVLDRMALLRKDAGVSLMLIILTFALLLWPYRGNDEKDRGGWEIPAVAISLLVLFNMFTVGKRYLNSSHFVSEREFKGQFTARPADEAILSDKSPSYRVLDLSVNVFNDSYPSYFHKNIGGYSPVKLQRYQDLIDKYLTGEINAIYSAVRGAETVSQVQASLPELPVLSMLNDKYIILDGNLAPVVNTRAKGPVWLVGDAVRASTADEEIALLGGADLSSTAVLGPDFAAVAIPAADSSASAPEMVLYEPNRLVYKYSLDRPAAAVFSEIYYPGWTASLEDGTPVDIFRADWTLRGAVLPAGDHELTMVFRPKSYVTGTRVSRCSSVLLLLLLAASCGAVAAGNKEDRI